MSTRKKQESVGVWLQEHYPSYDGNVTPDDRVADQKMVVEHSDLGVVVSERSYKRYGYTLSNVVAQTFAQSVGALELGFEARLTNCGMAAIATVIEALNLCPGQRVVMSDVLYGETPKLLHAYERYGAFIETERLGGKAGTDLAALIRGKLSATAVVVETVGNGPPMPVMNVRGLFTAVWDDDVTIVLDNTFLTCALLNPFKAYEDLTRERGAPRMRFVYVESLSKYYRADEDDPVTAGIIVASPEFIAECDAIIARTGAYLQFSSLRELPFDLFTACTATVLKLSLMAMEIVTALREHPLTREVFYPNSLSPVGAGGVFFFTIQTDSADEASERMAKAFGPFRGSFGHPVTTWLPWGTLVGGDPGVIRLAVGVNDSEDEIIAKLKTALD